jgi:catechol 2,3-dioxygenase-like lactoylglutathione lyase family enzyme
MAQDEFPNKDVVLTHLLVVSDLDRSKRFYQEVLGASLYREYGGASCVFRFQESSPPKDWGGEIRCFFRRSRWTSTGN